MQAGIVVCGYGRVGRESESIHYGVIVRLTRWMGFIRFVATLRGHVGAVYRLTWSADSRLLVSASKDSTLKVSPIRISCIGVMEYNSCTLQ